MIYGVLQKVVQDKDTQRIKAASGELIEKFGRTSYASLGALSSAKAMVEAGDSQTAKAQLLWVVDHAKDELRDGPVCGWPACCWTKRLMTRR